MKKHVTLIIKGKVQGVSYRFSAKQKATELGVVGCVENQNDGSVYVQAEGEREMLAEFVRWCERGPERARVDKVEVSYSDHLKHYKTFESIHGRKSAPEKSS